MGIFDRIRRFYVDDAPGLPAPVEVSKADVPQMPPTPVDRPVGALGFGVVAGPITEEEASADLRGRERWRTYAKQRRQLGGIAAALRLYMYLAGAPSWIVKPWKAADADEPAPEDAERAAWLDGVIRRMATTWTEIVMLHAVLPDFDGVSLATWYVRQEPDGRLAPADLLPIVTSTVDRWDVGPTGKLQGVVAIDASTLAEVPIDRSRMLVFRDLPTTTRPDGDGAMRFIVEHGRQLLALEKLRNQGFEQDVNGVPIIYAPIMEMRARIGQADDQGRVYTQADCDRDLADVRKFIDASKRKGAGVALDSSTMPDIEGNPTNVRRYAAEILSAAATAHDALTKAIRDKEWTILGILGMEHLAVGRDNGTQGMHESKVGVVKLRISSMLSRFAETIQRDLIAPLWTLNGFDPASPADPRNLPTLEWDALEFEDVAALANSITTLLNGAGITPGRADDVVGRVLSTLGLPALAEETAEERDAARDAAARRAGMPPAGEPDDPEDDARAVDDTEED